MASSIGRYALALGLLAFTVFGFLGSINYLSHHPVLEHIIQIVKDESGETTIPGAPKPFKLTYTGYEPVDSQLRILIAFFSAVIDGDDIPATVSAFSYWATAQLGSGWTIVLLESLRLGNAWNLSSFKLLVVAGFFIQTMTWTVTLPVWLSLNLIFSPVARLQPGDSTSPLLVRHWDLKLIPLTVLLSYVVPTIAMARSETISPFLSFFYPGDESSLHYDLLAFWQPFPLWNIILQTGLYCVVYPVMGPKAFYKDPTTGKTAGPGKAYTMAVSTVYKFAMGMAALTHVPVLAVCLLPESVRETLIEKAGQLSSQYQGGGGASDAIVESLEKWRLTDVFVPSPFWEPVVPEQWLSAGQPVSTPINNFLQYDIHTGTAALLVWAMYMHGGSLVKVVVKAAFWTVATGPAGAAAALLWDRDLAAVELQVPAEDADAKLSSSSSSSSATKGVGGAGAGSNKKPKERYGAGRSKKA